MNQRKTEQKKETKMNIENLEEFEQVLKESKEEFKVNMIEETPRKKDFLEKDKTNEIIQSFAKKSNAEFSETIIGIAALIQGGGTNASIPPFIRSINGKDYDLKTLREVVSFETSNKGTIRQLAKSMRDVIYEIALRNDWLGPLSKALQTEYPEEKFTTLDLVAASEIHEDNPNPRLPQNVIRCLKDRAQKIKVQRQNEQTKKKQKNKKRR